MVGTVAKMKSIHFLLKLCYSKFFYIKAKNFLKKGLSPYLLVLTTNAFSYAAQAKQNISFRVFTMLAKFIILNMHICTQFNHRTAFKGMQRYKELIASNSSALPTSLLFTTCFSISVVNGKTSKGAC